jgi:hypothetical protein
MKLQHTELSKSQYAACHKDLLSLLKQLHATGSAFQNFVCTLLFSKQKTCSAQGELDLPQITVIGNQSAGIFKPCL